MWHKNNTPSPATGAGLARGAEPPCFLEFKDVDTHYGDLHVLKQVNYSIGEGEIVSLLGGNASGKSTTMKTIMGVVRPTRGTVLYQGQAIERMATAERVRAASRRSWRRGACSLA